MAIRQFNVGKKRGLQAASAVDLPNIVAVAGSNGSGKSALLEQLWSFRHNFLEPGTEAIYVGPNRAWRAGPLHNVAVLGLDQDYEQVLKGEAMPGFQFMAPGGNNFLSGLSRFGSNADDAQSLVKAAIVRMQNRFQGMVAEEFRKQGAKVAEGTVPDLLKPLSDLVDVLLPHLEFVGVDATNTADIKVLFRSRRTADASAKGNAGGVAPPFDLDELSSGEKAAIALFLPFIERQVKKLAKEAPPNIAEGITPLTVLLDEPEIHLHPMLQLNMLEYMRRIASAQEAQFIFSTHSPTMLDGLEPEELFLLSPASLAPDNQLSRLATSVDKLEVARTITGSTHVLTRSKPILFIEGEPDVGATASDERLIKLILPQVEHWALVPAHGKSQVLRAVKDLRNAQLNLPGMPVFGLVDGDQGHATGDDHVISWPVAMVENLLLDPEGIAKVLKPYASIGQRSVDYISRLLSTIAAKRHDAEIELRIKSTLPATTIRPGGSSPEAILASLEAEIESLRGRFDATDMESVVRDAEEQVAKIESAGRQLDLFHGKAVLKALFQELGVSAAGLSWNAFVTELARSLEGTERVTKLTKVPLERIKLYFPDGIVPLLETIAEAERPTALIEACRTERSVWEQGAPSVVQREELRQGLLSLGHDMRNLGESAKADQLIFLAASIGT